MTTPAECCPTCGQKPRRAPGRKPRTETERNAAHDERVLSAVTPDLTWGRIVRLSRLNTTDATRARERLLADGRIGAIPAYGPDLRRLVGPRYAVRQARAPQPPTK